MNKENTKINKCPFCGSEKNKPNMQTNTILSIAMLLNGREWHETPTDDKYLHQFGIMRLTGLRDTANGVVPETALDHLKEKAGHIGCNDSAMQDFVCEKDGVQFSVFVSCGVWSIGEEIACDGKLHNIKSLLDMAEAGNEMQKTREEKPRWDFVYDEEYPDSNGYCCQGILTNGVKYQMLFFSICRDDNELIEHCSIRSSLMPIDGSEICRYPWTTKNDQILLDCLNGAGEHYGDDESPLYSLKFEEPDPEDLPKYAKATIVWNEDSKVQPFSIIKFSPKEEDDPDEKIFFYCKDFNDFLRLCDEYNGEDFRVVYWEPSEEIQ